MVYSRVVAPRRGAWVETPEDEDQAVAEASHPAGVRGLKLVESHSRHHLLLVAPRRGAWVETYDRPRKVSVP